MPSKKPKIVTRRKVESVRERADKKLAKGTKEPRRRKVADAATKPVKGVRSALGKEFHPIKLPDNRAGRLLTKKRGVMPGYFRESYQELREVSWPTKRQAATLSFAVIAFSLVLALFIRALDFGFEKLFREVILR